jgi:N-methylhydantoinase B
MNQQSTALHPVTFEVLKNSFVTIVDEMAEQLLRTCHSFVLYARDFSAALCDIEGNTVAQGTQDIAVHVGTLHFTAQAVIDAFGDDINPGDVFAVNDPYLGGTHFCDVRFLTPIFADEELLAFSQSNGHWADIGGSVPGSFDVSAREHFGEGLRITPVRLWDQGRRLDDVIQMIVSNTRVPHASEGDLHAQVSATKIAEQEVMRLVAKYGRETIVQAFAEVQDYVERLTRQRISELPDGSWETEDYIDADPRMGDGMIPIRTKLTISGDQMHFDLSGSHPAIGTFLNGTSGSSFSGVVTGAKMFFPDIPLNSGFYRAIEVDLGEEGTVVNAAWPTAVTGFCSGAYGKIVNSVMELCGRAFPERAIACCPDIEYLLVGGRDARWPGSPVFMWYDWMVNGWGGRNGRDGSTCLSSIFGVGEAVQPVEGQERLNPVITTRHEILQDSAGPGKYRGGCGANKGSTVTKATGAVMSYCCDRARSIVWGIEGGLPSMPQGLTMNGGTENEHWYGAVFSNVEVQEGDFFNRPAAGGGGYGDPLEREVEAVLEDVIDQYVSLERAEKDYGVVIHAVDVDLDQYEIDAAATERARTDIRINRHAWLEEDPASVAARFKAGQLDQFDCVRRFGVILNWGTGELLPTSTEQFRAMLQRRTVLHWGSNEEERAVMDKGQSMTNARLLEALAAWNSHDVDRVLRYMADDATYYASFGPELYGKTYKGTEELRHGIQQFFETYPDGQFVGTEVAVAGDRGSAEWTFKATGSGGEELQVRGCDLFEFAGDLIRVKNAFRKSSVPKK